MSETGERVPPLFLEFAGADLGDPRRVERLQRLADAVEQHSGRSLPQTVGDDAALEGAYRFLNNEQVDFTSILAPHYEATVLRASECAQIYAVSDSTEFVFPGTELRRGLGQVNCSDKQGFHSHFCLAVAADGSRRPLGLLDVSVRTRAFGRAPRPRRSQRRQLVQTSIESHRWQETCERAGERIEGKVPVVHVMDREADIFALLYQLAAKDHRFIVRIAQNRRIKSDSESPEYLFDAIEAAPELIRREVPISIRRLTKKQKALKGHRQHTARNARVAKLRLAARSVDIRRSDKLTELPGSAHLLLNVVHVFEPQPPPGERPVDWKLITTEPISSIEDVERVVDGYRTRWVIEEYFKALKTGCAFEKSQLESLEALQNWMAILAPAAWRLLLLRTVARDSPQASASSVLTAAQIEILRTISARPLPENLTSEGALLAVAALGGHIKNNGPPGWVVLGRGLQQLLAYEAGWLARERAHHL